MKKILMTAILIISLVVTLSVISAEFWTCFDYKEVRNYCNNYKSPETCGNKNGCEYCTSVYNATKNCYVHGVWANCNLIPRTCSPFGNTTIDTQPPILTITNPTEGAVYNSRAVLLNLKTNEKSKIYYTDLISGRGKWTPVCTNCFSYENIRSFKDGLNSLQFRATDVVENAVYKNVSFFVDSTKPKILKTEPANGFTSGDFSIQFKEDNRKRLYITYGDTNLGGNVHEVNITKECQLNNGKYYCDTHINLASYDGKKMFYQASLVDVANNRADSKIFGALIVDTTEPAINNLVYPISGKYVNFKFNVVETNFEEATYSYMDPNGRLRDGKLCSKLKDGICEKKLSLKTGHYDVSIRVIDEAGNSVGRLASFDIP